MGKSGVIRNNRVDLNICPTQERGSHDRTADPGKHVLMPELTLHLLCCEDVVPTLHLWHIQCVCSVCACGGEAAWFSWLNRMTMRHTTLSHKWVHLQSMLFNSTNDFSALCRAHSDHLKQHPCILSIAQKIYAVIDRQLGRVSERVSSHQLLFPPFPDVEPYVYYHQRRDKILGFYSSKAVLSQLCGEIMIHRSKPTICRQGNAGHFCFFLFFLFF